jgi:hypothetical protein
VRTRGEEIVEGRGALKMVIGEKTPRKKINERQYWNSMPRLGGDECGREGREQTLMPWLLAFIGSFEVEVWSRLWEMCSVGAMKPPHHSLEFCQRVSLMETSHVLSIARLF